jgi:hypothetical protein
LVLLPRCEPTTYGSPILAQSDRFKQLAREVEADPDEKAWDERLRKIAAQKPVQEPEEPE